MKVSGKGLYPANRRWKTPVKRPGKKKTAPALIYVYRGLLALILVLCLIFLAGTGYALFLQRNSGPRIFAALGIPVNEGETDTEVPVTHTFTGIGRLRLSTAEPQSAMVIVTITFPYSPEDRAFSEELAARVREFRSITEDYFQSSNARDLRNRSEAQVKADLLERFNQQLRLGKIQTLYFNDFMILDDE
jgi:flagellar FliL protein